MEIHLNRGMPGMPPIPGQMPMLLMLFGGAAIFLGLMLAFNEWLLRWLVAGVFIVFGAMLVAVGLRAKRMLG